MKKSTIILVALATINASTSFTSERKKEREEKMTQEQASAIKHYNKIQGRDLPIFNTAQLLRQTHEQAKLEYQKQIEKAWHGAISRYDVQLAEACLALQPNLMNKKLMIVNRPPLNYVIAREDNDCKKETFKELYFGLRETLGGLSLEQIEEEWKESGYPDLSAEEEEKKAKESYENHIKFITAACAKNNIPFSPSNQKGDKVSFIKALIKAGANVNEQDESGRTPLMIAALYENNEMASLLLQSNARIDLEDKDGLTVFGYICNEPMARILTSSNYSPLKDLRLSSLSKSIPNTKIIDLIAAYAETEDSEDDA